MTSILITQCLQKDFIEPIGRYDALPNQLHIGASESKRLMGERPDEGPLRLFMKWALAEPQSKLEIIHIRDYHDATDPAQSAHLAQFGLHCLKDSAGSEFVYQSDMQMRPNPLIVDASGMNDFYQTNLEELLLPYKGKSIQVGLIGVWTDAKIFFLAYELMTRYPEFDLAICEALTASSSRSMHFIAVEQIRRTLGVRICSTIGEFSSFLAGQSIDLPLAKYNVLDNQRIQFEGNLELSELDERMLLYLFRDAKQLKVKQLAGGFSGNSVLQAWATDVYGHHQPPHVIKIGERDLMAQEKSAFERIQETLGNVAPAIVDTVELGKRMAVKYRYAAMQGDSTITFKKFYETIDDTNRIEGVISSVFDDRLGRFYEAAILEPLNLLDYYGFQSQFGPGIRNRITQLLQLNEDQQQSEKIEVAGNIIRHPALFYENDLDTLKSFDTRDHFTSWLHGDLNGANIILDSSYNVWIIDFFHTHRGHILRDLIKLENDIQYIFTPLESEDDLKSACRLTDHLLSYEDAAIVPETIVLPTPLLKALTTIQSLRQRYAKLIENDRDPYQLDCAFARYAIHTISFDESSKLQRLWALYAGARHIERLRNRLIETRRLRVDYLKTKSKSSKIGITMLPGRRDRRRDLYEDLAALNSQKVESIICLLTDYEFELYGVPNLLDAYQKAGFTVLHSPIVDQSVPSFAQIDQILNYIDSQLSNNKHLLIHCVGGLGRSGTIAACYLIGREGFSVEQALQTVRSSRSPRSIENQKQEDFIRRFAKRTQ